MGSSAYFILPSFGGVEQQGKTSCSFSTLGLEEWVRSSLLHSTPASRNGSKGPSPLPKPGSTQFTVEAGSSSSCPPPWSTTSSPNWALLGLREGLGALPCCSLPLTDMSGRREEQQGKAPHLLPRSCLSVLWR